MVTDEQVRLLMSLLNQGIPQATAAAKAGMSERAARKYAHSGGRPPSQSKVAGFPQLRTRRFPGLGTTGFLEFRTS